MGRGNTSVSAFTRRLRPKDLSLLKRSSLFSRKLRGDKKVFPAIRKDRVDFYYGGGKLFSYERTQFRTHIKYASVIRGAKGSYVTEAQLRACTPVTRFEESYEDIKSNCSKLSGQERHELSKLHAAHSLVREPRKSSIVVLDIEAAFSPASREEDDGLDMIDLVLLDTVSREIRFIEGKRLDDPRIKAKDNNPEVVRQIARYRERLAGKADRRHLCEQYAKHIAAISDLYELKGNLPAPKSVNPEPGLFIFGFRTAHLGKVKELKAKLRGVELHVYAAGTPPYSIDQVFKACE